MGHAQELGALLDTVCNTNLQLLGLVSQTVKGKGNDVTRYRTRKRYVGKKWIRNVGFGRTSNSAWRRVAAS